MVLLLPWFAEEGEAGAQCAHTLTLPGGITHRRAGLAKGGEGQMAQSTGPDFCKSQENWRQIQTCPLSSATLSRKSYAIPNTEHFAEKKNNQIALTISSSAADYYSLYRSLPGFCSVLSGELYLPIQLP